MMSVLTQNLLYCTVRMQLKQSFHVCYHKKKKKVKRYTQAVSQEKNDLVVTKEKTAVLYLSESQKYFQETDCQRKVLIAC